MIQLQRAGLESGSAGRYDQEKQPSIKEEFKSLPEQSPSNSDAGDEEEENKFSSLASMEATGV